jgi:hypothetical protein
VESLQLVNIYSIEANMKVTVNMINLPTIGTDNATAVYVLLSNRLSASVIDNQLLSSWKSYSKALGTNVTDIATLSGFTSIILTHLYPVPPAVSPLLTTLGIAGVVIAAVVFIVLITLLYIYQDQISPVYHSASEKIRSGFSKGSVIPIAKAEDIEFGDIYVADEVIVQRSPNAKLSNVLAKIHPIDIDPDFIEQESDTSSQIEVQAAPKKPRFKGAQPLNEEGKTWESDSSSSQSSFDSDFDQDENSEDGSVRRHREQNSSEDHGWNGDVQDDIDVPDFESNALPSAAVAVQHPTFRSLFTKDRAKDYRVP